MGNGESKSEEISGGKAFAIQGGLNIGDALEEAVFDEDQLNLWHRQFMKVY